MSWPACQASSNAVEASDAGGSGAAVTRVLSPNEVQAVENLLTTVTYENHPPCGGDDGDEYYLLTYDASGNLVRKYSAQNINCYGFPAAPSIPLVYDDLAALRGS
jgi:hypothetical protein